MSRVIKRGDLFLADLGTESIGSEQRGIRPVLIIQNDVGNKFSPTVIVASITTKINKSNLPTHVFLDHEKTIIREDSLVMLEQIRTIDKTRLHEKIGELDQIHMNLINQALKVSLDI